MPESDRKILKKIRKNIDKWYKYWRDNNNRYKDDVKFCYANDHQWSTDDIREYREKKRVRLTFNMLPKYISNVLGQFRDRTPALSIKPALHSNPSPQEVNLREKITRNIGFSGKDAQIEWQNLQQTILKGGFGAIRILTSYVGSNSFQQQIKVMGLKNPTLAFFDPNADKYDKTDSYFAGMYELVDKDILKKKYNITDQDFKDLSSYTTEYFSYVKEDSIAVIDYFQKKTKKKTIIQLSNGVVIEKKNFDKYLEEWKLLREQKIQEALAAQNIMGGQLPIDLSEYEEEPVIVKQRISEDHEITLYKVIGNKILEKSPWHTKTIPMIYVSGNVSAIDEQEITSSLIRWAKDPQRAYNMARSEFLYRLKLTRNGTWITPNECISGKNEKYWRDTSRFSCALPYDPKVIGNNILRPEYTPPSEVSQSVLLEQQQSKKDIQDVLGLYEANIGAAGREVSGIAIAKRQEPANYTVSEYYDNVIRAMNSVGIIVNELIPIIYDTKRMIPLTEEDQTTNYIQIPSGIFTDSEFHVEIKADKPFELQKQETIANLMELIKIYPNFALQMMDLLIQNLDIRNQAELMQRAKQFIMKTQSAQSKPDPQTMIMQQQVETERMKAKANMIGAMAKMMDSETNQEEAQMHGVIESAKLQAEENRTAIETEKTAYQMVKDIMKQKELPKSV